MNRLSILLASPINASKYMPDIIFYISNVFNHKKIT